MKTVMKLFIALSILGLLSTALVAHGQAPAVGDSFGYEPTPTAVGTAGVTDGALPKTLAKPFQISYGLNPLEFDWNSMPIEVKRDKAAIMATIPVVMAKAEGRTSIYPKIIYSDKENINFFFGIQRLNMYKLVHSTSQELSGEQKNPLSKMYQVGGWYKFTDLAEGLNASIGAMISKTNFYLTSAYFAGDPNTESSFYAHEDYGALWQNFAISPILEIGYKIMKDKMEVTMTALPVAWQGDSLDPVFERDFYFADEKEAQTLSLNQSHFFEAKLNGTFAERLKYETGIGYSQDAHFRGKGSYMIINSTEHKAKLFAGVRVGSFFNNLKYFQIGANTTLEFNEQFFLKFIYTLETTPKKMTVGIPNEMQITPELDERMVYQNTTDIDVFSKITLSLGFMF